MKIKWEPIVKIKASLLFQWYVFEGSKKKYIKSSLGIPFGFVNQKIVSDGIFIDLDNWAKLEKILLSEVNKDYRYFQKFINCCYKYSSQLLEVAQEISKLRNLKSYSNKKLLEAYLDYQNSVLRTVPFLDTTLVLNKILNIKLTEILTLKLGIKDKKQQDLLLSKLIIPKKKSYFSQETEAILGMAQKIAQNENADIEQELEDYLKNFAWMTTIAYVGKPHTKNSVKNKIEQLVKENPKNQLEKAKRIKKEKLEEYKEAYKSIGDYPELVKLINYAREFLYLLNYRLDVLFKVHYPAQPLLKEIGSRFDLTVDELVYLTGNEIINLLKSKAEVNRDELKQRIDNYALIKINDKFTIQSGNQVKKKVYGKAKAKVIKGQIANRGRATGKVKLVFETGDLDKVERGDIMVSPMTRPNMVPAMMKAAGIITDFGGMLCHAAIISREFDVPCVVGTKNATKVFKDGDLIELNAYEGIIRKIK